MMIGVDQWKQGSMHYMNAVDMEKNKKDVEGL